MEDSINVFYYFKTSRLFSIFCSKDCTISQFIDKAKNNFNIEIDNLYFQIKSKNDIKNIQNAYLKGQKLDDEDQLGNHLEDIKNCPFFLSNDPTKSFEYNLPRFSMSEYEDIQFYAKNEGEYLFLATEKRAKKRILFKTLRYKIKLPNDFFDFLQYNSNYTNDLQGVIKIVGFQYPMNEFERKQANLPLVNINEKEKYDDITGYIFAYEFMKNGSITEFVSKYLESKGVQNDKMNPTIRSKIIFGIAAIMKQIHSRGKIQRALNIDHIYLDDNLEPKISDFDFTQRLKKSDKMQVLVTPLLYFVAPEVFTDEELEPKQSDVYSYAIILYRMFENYIVIDCPNKIKSGSQYLRYVYDGKRPVKKDFIPAHYWELIQNCWKKDPSERLTFDEIVEILKNDKFALEEFGMKTDINELHDYQNRIDLD